MRVKSSTMFFLLFFLLSIFMIPSSLANPLAFKFVVLSDTIVAEGYDITIENQSDQCYVSFGTSGVILYDIEDYTSPLQIANVTEQNNGYAHQLLKVGNNIYVGDGRAGLTVINWSSPDSPKVQNRTLGYYGWAVNVDEAYETLFLASGTIQIGFEPELIIFNISQTGQLDLITEFNMPMVSVDVEYVENKVFLTGENIPIVCIDVSNVSNPVELGRAEENPDDYLATDIEIIGEYAYVANWEGNIQVYSIQDPTSITLLMEIEDHNYGTDIESDGTLVYLADQHDGLIVFDVSTLGNLKEVAHFTSNKIFYRVKALGEFVFLTHDQGFMILQRIPITISGYNIGIISIISVGISCIIGLYTWKKRNDR